MNPLFTTYPTPHGAIPFDKISVADMEEGVVKGIEEHDKEIDLITGNPETPTFENTIEAYEHSGMLLDRASTILFNLVSAETSDELDDVSEKVSPLLSDHGSKTIQNKALFQRIKAVYDHYHSDPQLLDSLSTEERTLLDDTYDEFVRDGAGLDDSSQKRLAKLRQELSLLELKFEQNHLKDLNAYTLHITDAGEVKGVPETVMAAAADEANDRNLDGWVFTLHAPCYTPFLTYCQNRELRRQMYMAYNTLCTHPNDSNNSQIALDIVNKSREMARILGFKNYAAYVLEERMAEKEENVYKLLRDLYDAYMPVARNEVKAVEQLAKEIEGEEFELMPWDFSFYSNKLKERKFNINSEMVRPYLELGKVKEGVFGLATTLYGITFRKATDIPVYHKDVETYEVFDEDGSFLAILYCDFFPRPSKKSGAWMTSYKEQWTEADGTNSRPHVSVNTNFSKPTAEKPSLLTLGELETFLHEFGHALHGILSNTKYESLNGTNVFWDFVELPSQFMENYAAEREFLRKFAFHYQTGELIPDDLVENIINSRNFNVAYACIRQVSFGELDMSYYARTEPFTGDIMETEKAVFDHTRLLPYVEGTCMSTQFSHIMAGGYSAGYYSYKWAEVLDADAFSLFKQTGIFNKDTARKFRDNVLSRGGTEHPMTLYKRFRGNEPTIDALLERNGIK